MTWDGLATIVAAVISVVGLLAITVWQVRKTMHAPNLAHADTTLSQQAERVSSDQGEARRQRVVDSRRIRIGCVRHPPLCDFESTSAGVAASGLYPHIASIAMKDLAIDTDFVGIDWSELRYAFERYDVDLVLSVFDTSERRKFGLFRGNFHKVGVGALVRADDGRVKESPDLRKDELKFVVTRGEAGWEYVKYDLSVPRERTLVVESSNLSDMMDYVANGRADVAICDEVSCVGFARAHPNVKHVLSDDPVYLCMNSIMFHLGEELFAKWFADRFEHALAQPSAAEMEEEIMKTWGRAIRRHR